MNLMESDPHKAEKEFYTSKQQHDRALRENKDNPHSFLSKPYITSILLGIIAILLICIIVLIFLFPGRGRDAQAVTDSRLQQSITDYAQEQKQNDHVSGLSGETVSIQADHGSTEGSVSGQENMDSITDTEYADYEYVAEDKGKEPVVVEAEEENDVSYSKEFILNEALPYFADNNQPAVSDLAHLKRYVRLSEELKGTNQYYYIGDVDANGQPDGKGLAVYEDNSYYYGDWTGGVRNGIGRWVRFYINEKSKRNAMGAYTSHSYAGEWEDDLPNGEGAEHYDVDVTKLNLGQRVIQNVVGGFSDGLYDGELFGYTINSYGTVEEWNGSAVKGTFDLWRDMSSIGECSVWRNKEDETLYMDIDESDNKNQGIRELLKEDKSKSTK